MYIQRKVVIKFRKLFPDCYVTKPVHSIQILKKEIFVNGYLMRNIKEFLNMDGELKMNTKELLPRTLSQVCGPKQIVSIYTNQAPGIPQVCTKEIPRISVNKDKKIINVRPDGAVDKDMLNLINMYGYGIDQDTLRNQTRSSGGHTHMRFLSDLNFAHMWSQFVFGANEKTLVIDVGSKFIQVQNFLKHCGFKGDLQPVRPRSCDYDKMYYANNLEKYTVDEHYRTPYQGTLQ